MWTTKLKLWRLTLCIVFAVNALATTAKGEDVPSESQCRPYIEKALKELGSTDSEQVSIEKNDSSEVSVAEDTQENDDKTNEVDSKEDDSPSIEIAEEAYVVHASIESEKEISSDDDASKESIEDKNENESVEETDEKKDDGDSKEDASAEDQAGEESSETKEDNEGSSETNEDNEKEKPEDSAEIKDDDKNDSTEEAQADQPQEQADDSTKESEESAEEGTAESAAEADNESNEEQSTDEDKSSEHAEEEVTSTAEAEDDDSKSEETKNDDSKSEEAKDDDDSKQETKEENTDDSGEESKDEPSSKEDGDKSESVEAKDESEEKASTDEADKEESDEKSDDKASDEAGDDDSKGDKASEGADSKETIEQSNETDEKDTAEVGDETDGKDETDDADSKEGDETSDETAEESDATEESAEGAPEEDLLITGEIPENLRSRDHIAQILRLDVDASEAEITIEKSSDIVLRDLKKLYENSIKPLETLYKYRDLSNRHFGDPEIFSKPLVLFMGPWSGGKSSMVNYFTGLEFTEWSLRTGAEPSPAYFNILMHGKDPEVLDGTQLAADWTFSGLQKFGQGLEERLRGLKYPSKLLEKVNIVEIPGILEVRKQVSRVFPFNDACQWFIDRADIIFLVYDPSKLDVGPETEAILDQLKGRESQTRIILNKADSVRPEELMRVQSALIWNISPLMSSAQPPVMYTVSLWSMPYEPSAPVRLLQAQERELLRDLRAAIDKRIENKIASARRFAVRVRNHAKMVDCYLTTYYNHKTIFGNKKLISDAIIDSPQSYHIYEGLSTLTNISRYDLPDPETYRDFFRLNPLFEFKQLSATCTYFRGCPITQLDVSIAYDLPELVGKYKKMVETATPQGMPKT